MSPAFPTGGFAYSHGLEWSVEMGDVVDAATLTGWVEDLLGHGALWSDTVVLRAVYRGGDAAALAALANALGATAERRLESTAQGAAFARAAAAWPCPVLADWGDAALPYPVAVGVLARHGGVAEDDAALAYVHAGVANLISAAIRLIPLGQSAGLRVQAALEPVILATVAHSASATLDDLGGACWAADIAAMRHETQSTRLFRT